jgi:NADH:ubiquinone oxidoreductase subunit F (NADH-binding)
MTEAYAALEKRAREQWDAWVNDKRPRILVQTNSDSLASGADEVREAILAALAQHKVDATVTAVGSSGMTFADVMVDVVKPGKPRVTYGYVTPETAAQLITDVLVDNNPRPDAALGVHADSPVDGIPPFKEHPFQKLQHPIVMKNFGHVEPGNLLHYVARDGYKALDKALGMEREAVRKEVDAAVLRGRGGALFPAATKWNFMMNAPKPKVLAVNGEEGDPGAFSDKAIAENDPHMLLEGILIGAYTMGIDKTYIHIRAEYQVAVANLRRALHELEQAGLVGHNILGTEFTTEIEIEATGHAYICGEETALMDSVEGKRGTPRPRPPFPAAYGIFGRPTNINNVKTMSYVPQIILNGGAWFKAIGTEAATGTMFLSLSGTFKRRGFAEVPLGTPLKAVIEDMCGGSSSDSPIKGLQTGGPLGGATSWEAAKELKLEFAPLDGLGAPVGSGGIMAIDDHVCAVDLTLNLMEFNAAESCGKCFPCRKGTGHVVTKLRNIAAGYGTMGDLDEMVVMGNAMRNGSLCGLGQLAPRIINAMLRHFRPEFEAHIKDLTCRQGVCPVAVKAPFPVA